MKINCDNKIWNITREEHLMHNDFFLRYIEFQLEENEEIHHLSFHLYHDEKLLYTRNYEKDVIDQRLLEGNQEVLRYRDSSLKRILGIDYRPECVWMDEPFQLYLCDKVNELVIEVNKTWKKKIEICEYVSKNKYIFPLKGEFLVSDTYPSINSHRWCRNSEFAFDVASADLHCQNIHGCDVVAIADGVVIEVFDGLADSDETTDFDALEQEYSEHERIDGNHIMILHENHEVSIYSHLYQNSIRVSLNEKVVKGQVIGKVGSSGSSALPHLHFHMMLDGIEGCGIPVKFENVYSYFEQPCDLDETCHLIYTK